jgi:hypothetical protein
MDRSVRRGAQPLGPLRRVPARPPRSSRAARAPRPLAAARHSYAHAPYPRARARVRSRAGWGAWRKALRKFVAWHECGGLAWSSMWKRKPSSHERHESRSHLHGTPRGPRARAHATCRGARRCLPTEARTADPVGVRPSRGAAQSVRRALRASCRLRSSALPSARKSVRGVRLCVRGFACACGRARVTGVGAFAYRWFRKYARMAGMQCRAASTPLQYLRAQPCYGWAQPRAPRPAGQLSNTPSPVMRTPISATPDRLGRAGASMLAPGMQDGARAQRAQSALGLGREAAALWRVCRAVRKPTKAGTAGGARAAHEFGMAFSSPTSCVWLYLKIDRLNLVIEPPDAAGDEVARVL